MIIIAEYVARVRGITPDQRDDKRVALQLTVEGVVQRPTLSLTYEEAARVTVGQRVRLQLCIDD